ncbi:MAG: thioredoxin domain-containing protein [Vicinamibacteraceae bacterium]|nr:thioredoxin domain-containing protein [Vicinamibacteraceae bacterium]
MPNRLARESSPYLRQHAGNPVDWYPWGDEAFARASAEDRPVFLSVGYATCHWCHVMERESFEDAAIAELLNAHFVPVKVDREERPDVDRVYMTFVQATTGAGGWPMSVWLTPSLEPFFGGTYFPPASRWGRPGFREVLVEIARMWREDRARVTSSAAALAGQLRALGTPGAPVAATADGEGANFEGVLPGLDWLEAGREAFARSFDPRHGGFGRAPKFPRPVELWFLLREAHRTGDERLRAMVRETMQAMTLGGLRDQVGGGFHRYSVDAQWRVPHFEKMLYDQAQLVLTAAELAQATSESFWLWVAEDTLGYVERELTHHAGGFFSAEDADSVPHEAAGVASAHRAEGAFYLWTASEIDALFGTDAALVARRFGISPDGNAPDDPHQEFTGRNIPYIAAGIEALTAEGHSAGEVMRRLERARGRMLEARLRRPRPELDDKVLTAWNGLMIAAAARAARVFALGGFDADGSARLRALRMAGRAARFVFTHLWDETRGRLWRRWREGEAGIDAYCEDYASMAWASLELLQATGDPSWLEWAIRLTEVQDALFWDEAGGGWFSTTGEDPSVLVRLKEDYDGAEPSATSMAVHTLLSLADLVDRPEWHRRAARVLSTLGEPAATVARTLPWRAAAVSRAHAETSQVLVVGAPGDPATEALERAVTDSYRPFTLVVPVVPGAWQDALARHMPVVGALRMVDGRPTAYVCRRFTCQAPVTSRAELSALLS